MDVLVPVDGSQCSFRALEFATEFVQRYEGSIHVVHITDHKGPDTERLIDRAQETLADAGLTDEPEIITNVRMSEPKYANRVGRDILRLVEEEDYDHVVMGHHGTGRIGRAILGSAAETVLRACESPATIIP
jgi:nucleotide-binding universal stress UspA family protein